MPTSLPSREIYVIDIPDVERFKSRFVYNFYVRDEASNGLAGVGSKYSSTRSDLFNVSDTKTMATRVPRWVELAFKPVSINDTGMTSPGTMQRSNPTVSATQKSQSTQGLIAKNLSKVMTEEEFASYYYVSLGFRDTRLIDKLHATFSGSMTYGKVAGDATGASTMKSSRVISPNQVTNDSSKQLDSKTVELAFSDPSLIGFNYPTRQEKLSIDKTLDDITHVTVTTQVNAKFVGDMLERAIRDPLCHYDIDLIKTFESARHVQDTAREHLKSSVVSLAEYETTVDPVSVSHGTGGDNTKQRVEVVGYLIDKIEVLQNGTTIRHNPIVIENTRCGFTIDFDVRYYSTYVYAIRTVALVTMPAVLKQMNDLANVQFLVASRQTTSIVNCIENVPPPPVADLNFTWNYENENLLVHWSFPPNAQRDIKKFQVYRRNSVFEPFKLLKMYDFDDATIRAIPIESVDSDLIEVMRDPKTFFVDTEFNKQTKFIYAVTCVDAHGLASNYSAQFELSFDIFKNNLVKRLVSHSGAPRSYPNLYLEADAFVDTIYDGPVHQDPKTPSGPHGRLRIIFTPECYSVTKSGMKKPVVVTKQMGGKYRLQLLNIDNQKQQVIDIFVDDKLGKGV